jgi:hypothetical protein
MNGIIILDTSRSSGVNSARKKISRKETHYMNYTRIITDPKPAGKFLPSRSAPIDRR